MRGRKLLENWIFGKMSKKQKRIGKTWENVTIKKRNDVKKSDKSGSSLFEKEKARKAFQPHIFLQ